MRGSWLRRDACLPACAIYSMGLVRSGGRLAVHSALEAGGLLDPRKEAMEALDKMVDENIWQEITDHDGASVPYISSTGDPNVRSKHWMCLNTGAEGSGKTTMLRLSCNHFVNSSHPLRENRQRCAIFISFEDDPGQDCDKAMTAKQRVYNRILFGLRDYRDMGLEEFLEHRSEEDLCSGDIFARIREVCGEDAYVLIAADELRKCEDGHATDPRHAVQQKCVDAICTLEDLVCESFGQPVGTGHVYVVASTSSPVDVTRFQESKTTRFTLQPMLPIAHGQLRAALQHCGVDAARCDHQSQDLVRALLSCSTRPRCMALVESVRNNADAIPRLLAALQQMSSASNVDSYVWFVCYDFERVSDVVVAVKLLKLLFTPLRVFRRGCDAADRCLAPAIDAMCYDVCRVVPSSNYFPQDANTVMMHPCDIVALSERVITAMKATHAAAFPPTHCSRLFVEAVREFGVALRDASAVPIDGSGRGLVTLVGSLFHCLQFRERDYSICWLCHIRDRRSSINASYACVGGFAVCNAALVNARSVALRAHAAHDQHEPTWSVSCTVDVVEKRILPCVCAPADPYNVLLDVVFEVVPRKECVSARTLWIALRAGGLSTAGTLEAWRDRGRHLTASTVAARAFTQFADTVEILWVHVAVRKPSRYNLQDDEALLSLEGAKAWCPSLRFAEAAAAVWDFPPSHGNKEGEEVTNGAPGHCAGPNAQGGV